ncbi:MAG: hypothetical protein U0031_20685 [Thermomicrobiales bacterium]
MDGERFDQVARLVSGTISRRRLTRAFGAAGLLTTPMLYGSQPSVAGKRKKCKGGKKRCGGKCVDLQTNPKHCGRCNTVCADGKICAGGFCLTSCDNPKTCGAPLNPCAVGGGICVKVGGRNACVEFQLDCPPFAVESCAGNPCEQGRVCAEICCGGKDFICSLPA